MLRSIALILILSIAFQPVAKLLAVAWYQVNKTYIAKNLCENRSKPKMHCNGKCQLRKKLQQLEQEHSKHSPAPVKIDKLESEVCVMPISSSFLIPSCTLKKICYATYTNCYAYAFSNKLLKPPTVF